MSIYRQSPDDDRFKKIMMQMGGANAPAQQDSEFIAGLHKPVLGESYAQSLAEPPKELSLLSPDERAAMTFKVGESVGASNVGTTAGDMQSAKMGVDAVVGLLNGVLSAAEKQRLVGKKIEQLKAGGEAEGSMKKSKLQAEGTINPLRELMGSYRTGTR